MDELDRAQSIVELALREASGDEADVALLISDREIARFANSHLHQNMAERSDSLTIRVVMGGRMGVASTSSVDPESIRRTAGFARDLARRNEPLEGFHGLHRAAAAAPSLPSFDPATAALSGKEKGETLRRMFEQGRRRDLLYAGAWSTTAGTAAAGNTHGVRQAARFTAAEASVIALTDGRSGYATALSRRAADVDPVALAGEATERATLLAGTEADLEPGSYTVILEPPAVAEIFEWLDMIAFSGQAYEDGSSFFVGNRGTKLLAESVTIADDPLDPSFMPFPFDLEGLPKRRVPLVDHGVVGTPLVDKTAADRLGFEPTASASSLGGEEHGMGLHLALAPGQASRDELIRSTGRGIWVTRFHYLNGLLDPKTALMTGMTRDGTFLVEDGVPVRRLPNLRWTQSMIEAFRAIDGLSKERRTVGTYWNVLGGTIAPTVRIPGWAVTGKSGG